MTIVPLSIEEYDVVHDFWKSIEGMGLSGADSRMGIDAYLRRNPGMSFIMKEGETLVGTVLCGHDGRRGYIHHLAVAREYRNQGVGRRLVQTCMDKLRQAGIQKCHIFIFVTNNTGKDFWRSIKWQEREDICIFSHDIDFPSLQ